MFKFIKNLFPNKSNKFIESKNISESKSELVIESKSQEIINKMFDSENKLTELKKDTVNKWIPNDDLVRRYDNFTLKVGKIPSLKNKLRELKITQNNKSDEYDRFHAIEDKTIVEKLLIMELKNDLLKICIEVSEIEEQIKNSEKMNSDIFTEWEEYLLKANLFIQNNKLFFLKPEDIMRSSSLMIIIKKNMDSLLVEISEDRQDEALKILANLDQYFDITGVIKLRSDLAKRYRSKQEQLQKLNQVEQVRLNDREVLGIEHTPLESNLKFNLISE